MLKKFVIKKIEHQKKMPIKIGINGMGRIGRMVVRSVIENYKGIFKLNILIIDQVQKFVQTY